MKREGLYRRDRWEKEGGEKKRPVFDLAVPDSGGNCPLRKSGRRRKEVTCFVTCKPGRTEGKKSRDDVTAAAAGPDRPAMLVV